VASDADLFVGNTRDPDLATLIEKIAIATIEILITAFPLASQRATRRKVFSTIVAPWTRVLENSWSAERIPFGR